MLISKVMLVILDLSVCLHVEWNSVCPKAGSTLHDIGMTPDDVTVINVCQRAAPWRQLSCVWWNVILFCKVINIWQDS